MMNNQNKQNPGPGSQPKNYTSSDRLATCSMLAGITGLICSLLYFPISLARSMNYPAGLICGIIGIVLAVMSRNADIKEKKSFNARAITGIVLSAIAIAMTFFFFYLLGCYYEILRDPEMGPKFNEYIYELQQQINQQMHLQGGSSWIHI